MKKFILLTLLSLLLPLVANAYDAEIDGIYYNFSVDEATVTYETTSSNSYSGNVVIPASVTYNSKTYSVTSIGWGAFYWCLGLTSVTIPEGVTSIGSSAFHGCTGLTSITIPNSVTRIGEDAFFNCSSLTSITIPESVTYIGNNAFYGCYFMTDAFVNNSALTSANNWRAILVDEETSDGLLIKDNVVVRCRAWATVVTIPDGVTSIGNSAFSDCSSLTSVIIPDGVTSIGNSAFSDCTSLTSITIPESVTSIGNSAFSYCSSLTSVTIPNSVTSIGSSAFYYCSGLTSVTIPESITIINGSTFTGCSSIVTLKLPEGLKIIRSNAFSYCRNLKSLTIPSTVEFIYQEAFANCSALSVINAMPATPPFIYVNTFSNFDVPLKVPAESVGAYKTHDVWKNFKNIETTDGGEIPDPEKCATPTISYNNGELAFGCDTEDVEFAYEITDSDIKKGYTAKVSLTATYNISVYAMKAGYESSDIATATLCWIDAEPKTEGLDEDAVMEVKALPVLIQTQGGIITIQGAAEGTPIAIYDVDGREYGSTTSEKGRTTIATSLQPGSVAIVKIGEKSVRVLVK